MELSKQDLLFVGGLYFRELATEAARISDRELRQQLSHAAVQLGMEDDVSQLAQVIDRLVRFRMVRTSVTDSRAQEYCLARLGRSLARDLLEDADFGSEDLCTLLNQAHASLRQEMTQGDPAELAKWLARFFHGTNREKIEYCLHAAHGCAVGMPLSFSRARAAHRHRTGAGFSGRDAPPHLTHARKPHPVRAAVRLL